MIPPVRLHLQPSFWLAACVGGLHLAALAAACLSLRGWLLTLILGALLLSAVATVGMALLRHPRAILELELQPDYSARWRDGRGGWHAGSVAMEGYVSAWLVLLALDALQGRGRQWVVLGPDSAPPDVLRSLRLALRSRQDQAAALDRHDAR